MLQEWHLLAVIINIIEPWLFPKYMVFCGTMCSYWVLILKKDWNRRIYLEDICKNEERIEFRSILIKQKIESK